jgi:hypothetical protein
MISGSSRGAAQKVAAQTNDRQKAISLIAFWIMQTIIFSSIGPTPS